MFGLLFVLTFLAGWTAILSILAAVLYAYFRIREVMHG